ncbi:methyl-accepting chemotaxis protein [Bacillus alkalicellulosilyticus]|uniref:methyl-accepting chemotaxis protein n=1 Tax=Alkalihalobacterium alkalicellulosilyticum TaxID=1912214 RepID=UPI0014827759|nr:methyl-accepting chemotaxis protein [Bacillus alkalicellulosilyticus]
MKILKIYRINTITRKFMVITTLSLMALLTALFLFRYNQVITPIEQQYLNEGKSLAVSLAKTIEGVTEVDLKNGVTLGDGAYKSGSTLKQMLFNDSLTVYQGAEDVAKMRTEDTVYAEAKQLIFDGREIPMWQYELKYESEFDVYTDERWQRVIDSYLISDSIVFALPIFYSENQDVVGYIPTHNTEYSLIGTESKDQWGTEGILSQKYRANRVFNDAIGYNAAANTNTEEPFVQMYDRVIEGKIVKMWDISYPLYFDGQHWGAVRVAKSQTKLSEAIAIQRNQMIVQYSIIFTSTLVLIFTLSTLLVKRRLDSIMKTASTVFENEKLDLTQIFDSNGNDEISRLSSSLNQMIDYTKRLVRSISTVANEVSHSSVMMNENVDKTVLSADQFYLTIQEVKTNSERQAASSKEGATAMEEIASGVQRISESTAEIAYSSSNVVNQLVTGNEQIDSIVEQMTALRNSSLETKGTIEKLNELSQNIGEFASMITDISNQTNIISMNASIEASRSGESGKGFKVIAEEVRNLSSETRHSSEKIVQAIAEIQVFTQQAVAQMENNTMDVEDSVQKVNEIGDAMRTVLQNTHDIDVSVQEVSASSQEISAGVEEVSASMEEMSDISGKSASHTMTAVGSYEDQLQILNNISQSANQLGKLASKLQEGVRSFKIT